MHTTLDGWRSVDHVCKGFPLLLTVWAGLPWQVGTCQDHPEARQQEEIDRSEIENSDRP